MTRGAKNEKVSNDLDDLEMTLKILEVTKRAK